MSNSKNFRQILASMGLEYKKNKLKKMWRNISEEDQQKILNGDILTSKNIICLQVMGEPWNEDEMFQRRWREHTGQTKQEFATLCAELEEML